MEKSSVWSRVGAWLRGEEPHDSFGVGASTTSPAPPTAGASKQPSNASGAPPASVAYKSSEAAPPRMNGPMDRASSSPAESRRADERIAEFVASIKDHLEAQVQGSDVLVGALDRLADGLERLPSAAKDELGLLERINGDLASGIGTLKRIESTLTQMPRLADAQREVMVSLNDELGRLRETDAKIVGVLEGVQQVMVELRDGVGRSAGAMREFRTEMAERHDRLAQLVELQSRRFVSLGVGAVALGVVALILGIVSVLQ